MPTLMLEVLGLLEHRSFTGTNTAFVPTLLIQTSPRTLDSPQDQNKVLVFGLTS